jgi:putative GTP pyrophosphokinase
MDTNVPRRGGNIDISILAENKAILEELHSYIELQQIYNAAIREISTKLEILNEDFKVRYDHNPIHHMESRLKSPKSMLSKLKNRGFDPTIESAVAHLHDIAGIRVICCYIRDVYRVADMLLSQADITLVCRKDYIKTPKPNGYRSLHLVVNVPIFLSDRVENIPVEVQLRTVAMDLWASLEHQLRYKKDVTTHGDVDNELKKCAEEIASIDLRMQQIHNKLEQHGFPESGPEYRSK